MAISTTTQELLKAHAGRESLDDPALLIRRTRSGSCRTLENAQAWARHSGPFVLPDESQTCSRKLRVILGLVYTVLVERRAGREACGREHHVLPAEAVKERLRLASAQ